MSHWTAYEWTALPLILACLAWLAHAARVYRRVKRDAPQPGWSDERPDDTGATVERVLRERGGQ